MESFLYIGSDIMWNSDCSKHISRIIQLVNAAYRDLQSMRTEKKLIVGVKFLLLDVRLAELL